MRGRGRILVACWTLILVATFPAAAIERVDVEEQLRIIASGENPTPRISGAEFRIGTFTYEDPDGTGLGNALAALVGHEMLLNTNVRSLGVLVFEGSLSPKPGDRLGYYDKVDQVTEAQGVSIATWGVVRRIDDELLIDTFVQIPPEAVETHFAWDHALPEAMGGGVLRSRLRPDRIRVQRLRVPASALDSFVAAAGMLSQLREAPTRSSRVQGNVPKGEVYYVRERADEWALLQTQRDRGWVPIRGHCTGPCAPLLEAAAFAAALVRFMANPDDPPIPEVTPGLSADALAVSEQLEALVGLRRFAQGSMRQPIALASRWTGPERSTGPDALSGIDRGAGVPPGGAAFANLQAIAAIGAALDQTRRRTGAAFNELDLPQEAIRRLADDLAKASLDDPRNVDVLENLAVLFDAVGDQRRAGLAREIAQKAGPRPTHR